MGRIRVGCSGWNYPEWRKSLYEPGLRQGDRLRSYGAIFDSVELNNSFYRLPTREQFAAWRREVSPRFLFAVKASRYLTHIKRLREPEEPIHRLLDAASGLGPALGPLLYQLPPRWLPDAARLRQFVSALPRKLPGASRHARVLRHVIEFRDARLHTPDMFELLERHGVALCLHDMPGSRPPRIVVGPCVYVRFHGTDGRYAGSYDDGAIADWAEWLAQQVRRGLDVFAYFNNTADGAAPNDARRLRAALRTALTSALEDRVSPPTRGAFVASDADAHAAPSGTTRASHH